MTERVGCMAALLLIAGCSSATEPEDQRVLGLVSQSTVEDNPRSWVVEGRRFRVAITTEGGCKVTQPDWEVQQTDGYINDPGFVFILPYEYRRTRCPSSHSRVQNSVLFTHTLELEFELALEATVRVVSRDGAVYDMHLDFHLGWPAQITEGVRSSVGREKH